MEPSQNRPTIRWRWAINCMQHLLSDPSKDKINKITSVADYTMQKGDITEILKVFEKRITKLESKVVELGSTVEDIKSAAKYGGKSTEGDKSVKFKSLDTMFDELSMDKAPARKITYDKSTLLGIRPTTSNDSEFTAHTDTDRSISVDFLEEGEVYEPPTEPAMSVNPASQPVGSPRNEPRGRQVKEKKRHNHVDNPKQPSGVRERSKSEPMMEKVCRHYVKKEAEKIEVPECKSEMHYGLLVQYPPEDEQGSH